MDTIRILQETTLKFVLTGIIKNGDRIRNALDLQGYQLSINPDNDKNITVVIATKRDDDVMSVII